ncbi:MAG: methyltransferase [Burkholderiales bacterium]
MNMQGADMTEDFAIPKSAKRLRGLILGYFVSRAVHVAAELDLASHLGNGSKDSMELAALCGVHAPTLNRVMRMLASVGVFTENDGRFSNNDVSQHLRGGVPQSMRAVARMFGADFQWRPAQALMHSVQTGEPGFRHVFGEDLFSYLSRHPGDAQLFDEAMVSSSDLMNRAIVNVYDFSGFGTLVDVAGGYGSTLCAVLEGNPKLKGTLFDLPHVVAKSKGFVESKGLQDRCSWASGNFLETVPKGADAYFMKHIIHDWDDERCLQLLHNCHAAMPAHAKLLVCEKVLPEANDAPHTRILDLVMLLHTPGGRERTEPEYRALFEKAGFHLVRTIPTKVDNSILEVVKI